ncbi:MAG: aminopeptidase P family protein [Clostridia bacterium]|nr:aminopeptidase P family protein [Clostridia bacterium]
MKKLPLKDGFGYLITDRLTRFYLSGADIAEGYILYAANPLYFTDARYFFAAEKKLENTGFTPVLFHGEEDIEAAIKDCGIKELAVDYGTTTVKDFLRYETFGAKVVDCADVLRESREIKTEEEIDKIKKACAIAEKAVSYAFENVRAGITERELCALLEKEMVRLGAEGPSFDTIVAFGENAAVPHHETGDTALKENSVVLIDTGAKVGFYLSDITRTAFFGVPDKEFTDDYDAVLSANETAEREIVAGTDVVFVDKIARDVLKERGLDGFFTHSLGHGVGIEIHESPYLSPKGTGTLKENAVFTVEPGVYKNGRYGIRIEDTCLLRNGKTERLFKDSKELKIIPIK